MKISEETKWLLVRIIGGIIFGVLFASRACLLLKPIVFLVIFLIIFYGWKYYEPK